MAIVIPQKTRVAIEQVEEGLRIVIPSKKNWLIILFLGFWLCAWALGEVTVLGAILGGTLFKVFGNSPLRSDEVLSGAFMLVWLCGWTVGGAFALATWLYRIKGKEVIQVGRGQLAHTRDFVIHKRKREYLQEHISDIRVSTPMGGLFNLTPESAFEFWGISGGSISFDYGSKTIRIGTGLDEAEAKPIAETLRKWIA